MKKARTKGQIPQTVQDIEGIERNKNFSFSQTEEIEEWIHETAKRIADVIKLSDEQNPDSNEDMKHIEEKCKGRGGGEVFIVMMRILTQYFAYIGLDEGVAKNLIFYILMELCEDNRSMYFEALFDKLREKGGKGDPREAYKILRYAFSEKEAQKIHSLFFPRRGGMIYEKGESGSHE
jgi:hypothetical protein